MKFQAVGVPFPKVSSKLKGMNTRSTHGNMKGKKNIVEFIATKTINPQETTTTHMLLRSMFYIFLHFEKYFLWLLTIFLCQRIKMAPNAQLFIIIHQWEEFVYIYFLIFFFYCLAILIDLPPQSITMASVRHLLVFDLNGFFWFQTC